MDKKTIDDYRIIKVENLRESIGIPMSAFDKSESARDWAIRMGLLEPCHKHKIDFDPHIGCPECAKEKLNQHLQEHKKDVFEHVILGSPPNLQPCPSCKQRSLMLNKTSNRYECLNTKCGETFFRETVDRFNQLTATQSKALEELSEQDTRAWAGYQYFDPKKKKWRDGERPIRVTRRNNKWSWIIIP